MTFSPLTLLSLVYELYDSVEGEGVRVAGSAEAAGNGGRDSQRRDERELNGRHHRK